MVKKSDKRGAKKFKNEVIVEGNLTEKEIKGLQKESQKFVQKHKESLYTI